VTDILLVAAGALLDTDGRVLICQRPEGKDLSGLWEFPGGKVEAGETPEAALIRELNEELGIVVGLRCLLPLSFVSHDYGDFHLLMPLFTVRRWDGIPQSLEGQALKWVWPKSLHEFPMPPADVPLVTALTDSLRAIVDLS
jgi:8-oxo-dGTP diphosphatase